MRAWRIAILFGSLCLAADGLSATAWGQADPARLQSGASIKAIGKILTASGSVTVEHTAAVVVQAALPAGGAPAKAGDLVYQGDVIQTGADGSAGIIFGDSTSFKISSNARMELNEFVYDPNSSSNSLLFNLHRGAFTFLAGAVAKTGNMKVETPAATMGIRGTAPRVEILDDGTVRFSTLIEENKGIQVVPRVPPAAAPGPRRAEQPRSAPSDLDRRLRICRNC